MRILILKPSSLGDIIHALPTVNLIRRRYPAAHITWLVNAEFASVLQHCPVINERIEFHRRAPGTWLPLLRRLCRERFDLVLDLQCLLRSGFFAFITRAPRRLGLSDAREGAGMFYNEIVPVSSMHAVERYLLAAKQLDCPAGPVEFPLGLPVATRSKTDAALIALNPCARWESKIWGDDNFAALLDRLPASRVVLIGSAGERDRIESINCGRARNAAGTLNLYELAQLYRQCAVVITNDTGPMHLAVAAGTPVIALFGPTDPALVGPYGPGHTVIRSPTGDMRAIKLEQVLAAAKAACPGL